MTYSDDPKNCREGIHADIVLDGRYLPVAFRTQSHQIARDIVTYQCMKEDANPPPNRCCQIMRSLVDDTLRERMDMMKYLVETLRLSEREQLELIRNIASKMFEDQVVTWGRIVILHSFCAYLARHCEESLFPDCAEDIAKILADIVVNRLGLWIMANGGWKSFERQFPSIFMFHTSGVWKAFVIMGLLIGSAIAFYTSVRFMNG